MAGSKKKPAPVKKNAGEKIDKYIDRCLAKTGQGTTISRPKHSKIKE